MIKQNILITFRGIKRNKSSFFLNLIGLSTGLACVLLIYFWVNDEFSFDKFHKTDSQLFQVMTRSQADNGVDIYKVTSCILAENLIAELPEIEYAVPVGTPEKKQNILSFGNNMIKATALYSGKDFFSIFSYNLIQGNEKQVLSDENNIVISEEIARKLFNTTENIVGKNIEFDHKANYVVSGVFHRVPLNSSTQFDCVLPLRVDGINTWGHNYFYTYLILKRGINIDNFNKKASDIFQKKTNDKSSSLFIRPYSEQYLYGKYENGVQSGGRIEYIKLFSIIALFILLIACINFMNLSTAKSSGRAKEIGIKKAIGSTRKSLIFQFLGESMFMTSISLLVAIVLVMLFIPQFNEITGKHINISFDRNIILFILGIFVFTGIISGSYPALFLSSFNALTKLKGKLTNSIGELWVRKGLVVFQFTLSIILIISVLVVYKQIEFTQTENLGYNKDNVIYFAKEGRIADNLEDFLSEIKNVPGIVNASSISWNLIDNQGSTDGVNWKGKSPNDKINFYLAYVNYDLIETLGINMKEGRTFSKNFGSDRSKIIFNETAIKTMGLKNPIGEVINLWGDERQIIGVTKDFHFQSLHEEVKPSFFLLYANNNSQILVKIKVGTEKETISKLREFYQKYNPGFPFDFKFLDQDYQALYIGEKRVAILSRYFAGLAILISCLGLFGLAAFTAERRIKEIGVRKVNGAKVTDLVAMLNRDFIKEVTIAYVISCPIAWYAMNKWLQNFAYKTELSWWVFATAGLIAMAIALLTVSAQSFKTATRNPVEALRYE
jgi:putative ABC transport system permease protein